MPATMSGSGGGGWSSSSSFSLAPKEGRRRTRREGRKEGDATHAKEEGKGDLQTSNSWGQLLEKERRERKKGKKEKGRREEETIGQHRTQFCRLIIQLGGYILHVGLLDVCAALIND